MPRVRQHATEYGKWMSMESSNASMQQRYGRLGQAPTLNYETLLCFCSFSIKLGTDRSEKGRRRQICLLNRHLQRMTVSVVARALSAFKIIDVDKLAHRPQVHIPSRRRTLAV